MKSPLPRVLVCCLLTTMLMSSSMLPGATCAVAAQEKQEEAPSKKIRKKPRGRVPNHYGKLGLSAKQKATIYAIQAKYDEQVESLEDQIRELEEQEAAEVRGTLTADQKESLRKILEDVESRKKNASE